MPVKHLLWIAERWRSLEELEEEGQRLKFAVVRNGVIYVLRRPPKACNVIDGPPLPYRIIKKKKKCKRRTTENGVPVSVDIEARQPIAELKKKDQNSPVANAKAYKSFPKITASNQNILKDIKDRSASKTKNKLKIAKTKNLKISSNLEEKGNVQKNIQKDSAQKNNVSKTLEQDNIKKKIDNQQIQVNPSRKKGYKNLSQSQISHKLHNVDSSAESASSGQGQNGSYLELQIKQEDLELIRMFFSKTPVFKVDMKRFDNDHGYQLASLYKLQPTVDVVPLAPRLHHQLSSRPRSSSRTNLEKKSKSTTAKSSGKVSKLARRRSPVKLCKSSVPPGREYSSLEDHAIVSWLSVSRDREHAVNGNRVWRELEQHHARITGQERSWHSLRNRYLRYILPKLSLLALSPSHAQRLRAAAATGELKKRKNRRPSILHEPPLRTAHQRAFVRPAITRTDSDADNVKASKAVCRSGAVERRARSPLTEKHGDKSDDNDSDSAPRESLRLRPRPSIILSKNSNDDKSSRSPLRKKRRKLFNPLA